MNGNAIGFHPQTQKLELRTKQIALCERTAEEVSFKWYHRRVSFTELAVRPSKTRLYNGCRSELWVPSLSTGAQIT